MAEAFVRLGTGTGRRPGKFSENAEADMHLN